jgi:hypothetical protein
MTTPRLSGQDLRAAAEAHRELPAEYSDAVVDSFLAKVEARIDERLAELAPPRQRPPARVTSVARRSLATGVTLGGGSAGTLLSLAGLVTAHSLPGPSKATAVWALLLVVSMVCVVVGMARAWRDRREL